MLKFLIGAITILLFSVQAYSSPVAFSFKLGADFFNYTRDNNYLDMGVAYFAEIQKGMEFELSGDFALITRNFSNTVIPVFFLPVNAGLNFTFPVENFTFLVGFGLSPLFQIDNGDPGYFRFYIGPFIKTGMRLKVHELMQWFIDVQQDILIGSPAWINNATLISTGLHFSFGTN